MKGECKDGCCEVFKERARQLGVDESSSLMIKASDAEVLVRETEKWSKEHPKKTKGDLLKVMFPNVKTLSNDAPSICPNLLGAYRVSYFTLLR